MHADGFYDDGQMPRDAHGISSWTQNMPAVEKNYLEKMKQSPARAKFSAEHGRSEFHALDRRLAAREQRIADTLYRSGDAQAVAGR
ncbi:hypothetical protein AWB75_03366 [Caballeronia catudaia]|uniref:Uncharacterized protein n=1 Tax=Caballeronia catudaia TaxID=1777136 RepID=A0A158BEH9_9BURK|nr:hypothetical protein [Caballeronia catudaia]SAK68461.1 hypothetical protein AWB75_03366 [Caballeronia catudaia]